METYIIKTWGMMYIWFMQLSSNATDAKLQKARLRCFVNNAKKMHILNVQHDFSTPALFCLSLWPGAKARTGKLSSGTEARYWLGALRQYQEPQAVIGPLAALDRVLPNHHLGRDTAVTA